MRTCQNNGTDRVQFLLYTREQEQRFRKEHSDFISKHYEAYREWFQNKPLYTWLELKIRPGKEEDTIGLLCILHIDGKINLTVNNDVTKFQRGAITSEEFDQYISKL